MVHHFFFQKAEFEVLPAFLGPFEQTALEVDLGLLKLLEVDVHIDDAVDDDVLGELEAFVEVDGPNQGLEGIAAQRAEALARAVVGFVFDEIFET